MCDVDRDRIEAAIADVVRGERGVVSAYVFGSHAKGRAHRESDIDVAVLLDRTAFPRPEERFDAQLRLIARLGAALKTNAVDLVILNDAPPTFARHILTEGRRIYRDDAEKDHAFLRDTLLRAADLEPFLRRMRRIKLAALAR